MCLQVIAGLGNPGLEYKDTRHNIGFLVLDALAQKYGATWKHSKTLNVITASCLIFGKEVMLVKPQTFMNRSGIGLGAVSRYYKIPSIQFLIVYDEYQLPTATLKLSLQGGDGGHNGIKDLHQHFGLDFLRLRIGIGPESERLQEMHEYVLDKFSPAELDLLKTQMPKILDGVALIIDKGAALAMNTLNSRNHKNDTNTL
jgi:PTH1 family peptidyl-tRNA hydrolase